MDKIETGGPAFPCEVAPDSIHENAHQISANTMLQYGMTLRDYMAAHTSLVIADEISVAHGELLLGRKLPEYKSDPHGHCKWWAECRSILRYMEADAMLKAREA